MKSSYLLIRVITASAAYGWLGVVRSGEVIAIRCAQDKSQGCPIFAGIKLLATDPCFAFDGGAHSGITNDASLVPIRNHLLVGTDPGCELDLAAGDCDRLGNTSLGRRFLHGAPVNVYKYICSTGYKNLQAFLLRFYTKSFV
jgi:hypothetical protein